MNPWASEALAALNSALRGETPPLEFLPAGEDGVPRWVERPDVSRKCQSAGQERPERDTSQGPAHLLDEAADQPAVVVRTSGSTGTPKQTLLTAENLRASAEATAEALTGHGQWLLTLQPSYVAGLAVLSRSLLAGTAPVTLLEHTTDPERFTQAAEELTGERRYVSLVPTQLQRLLDAHAPAPSQPDGPVSVGKATATDPERQEHAPQTRRLVQRRPVQRKRLLLALQRFDAILLGGGPSPPALITQAESLGLRVIRTYGMSETAGGCIYDGRPLPGVRIRTFPETHPIGEDARPHDAEPADGAMARSGRVVLSGPMVAVGYLDPELSASRFDVDPTTGHRRFLTDDLGRLTPDRQQGSPTQPDPHNAPPATGSTAREKSRSSAPAPTEHLRLQITGRADDVIITGGVKISAEEVRCVLEADPQVREAFVAGVPDSEWGQSVAAAVVLDAADDQREAVLRHPEDHDTDWKTLEFSHRRAQEGCPALTALNSAVRDQLGPPAVPKQTTFLRSLPRMPSGKPDRQELIRILSRPR